MRRLIVCSIVLTRPVTALVSQVISVITIGSYLLSTSSTVSIQTEHFLLWATTSSGALPKLMLSRRFLYGFILAEEHKTSLPPRLVQIRFAVFELFRPPGQ